ncbi:hypothetical protein DRJ19_04755 [Candidatus Woesearchaeota archaeon]|nr:MAG: hypothetical protein DRJ19_04755 [Candidatus Woesearchaeota archaeon]
MHPITGALTIYNSLDGASEGTPDPQQEALKYKGTRLNPQVFGRPKYTMITLDSFGVEDWWSGPWHGYETESVKYEFTVHVFVVGKWVVRKEHSEDFIPHPGIIEKTPWDKFWGDFFKLLGMANPFAIFGKYASLAAFIALCLVIIIIIAIVSKIFSQRVRFEVYPPYPYRGRKPPSSRRRGRRG